MKPECREIQRALAEGGPEALRTDERAQDHVAECADCFAFLEAAAEVDAGLARLAPIDAPDEVVDELLATLSDTASEQGREPSAPGAQRGGWSGLLLGIAKRFPPRGSMNPQSLTRAVKSVASWCLATAPTVIASRKVQLTVATAAVLILAALITPQLLMRSKLPMSAEELQDFSQTGQEVAQAQTAAGEPRAIEPEKKGQFERLGYLSDDADGQDKDDLSETAAADPSDRESKVEVASPGEATGLPESLSERFSKSTETVTGKLNDLKEQEERDNLGVGNKNARDRRAGAFGEQSAEPPAGQPAPSRRGDRLETVAKSSDSPMPLNRPSPALLDERERRGELESDLGLDLERGLPTAEQITVTSEAPMVDKVNLTAGATVSAEADRLEGGALGDDGAVYRYGNRELAGNEEAEQPRRKAKLATIGGGLGSVSDGSPSFENSIRARDVAERFLEERERIEGVVFRPATGYWANTYVPGDPLLRLLYSKLQGSRLERFRAAGAAPVALHTDVIRLAQPFDPPQKAALAVYLHSDRAHLEGRQRMLLQVGLQGTARSSGRRGAMNVGLVLDLGGELAPQSAAAVRALVEAFGEARDIGDRFHLIVAGRATGTADGVVVPPDRFRHGPLRVAVEGLLADTPPEAGSSAASVHDLQQAMETAMDRVAGAQDPRATLGSSVVVLVTARALGDRFETLRRLVHTSAIAGVPVSVVGVGDLADPGELERLALWGQGNRRLLEVPAGATALVDRELTSASRTIARAVRLRIRLAPGVELIDVFGSRRLDDEDSRRVREAESNIDLRLARNLGIAADRGEDEEGIQIVMPGFQAGDSHVILLDVVAPGPGPVADVTVRYKDLVYLRNGVGRAHLELGRSQRPAGALETNVLENLLAHSLFEGLDAAGRLLQAGDPGAARERLVELRSLLSGLTLIVPGLDGDASLGDDTALLDEYLSVLEGTDPVSESDRTLLADSLRLSGRLKVSSRPTTTNASRR